MRCGLLSIIFPIEQRFGKSDAEIDLLNSFGINLTSICSFYIHICTERSHKETQ